MRFKITANKTVRLNSPSGYTEVTTKNNILIYPGIVIPQGKNFVIKMFFINHNKFLQTGRTFVKIGLIKELQNMAHFSYW